MSKKKVDLLITSAVMLGGVMIVPGKGEDSIVVGVEQSVARNLLDRGKAEVLTEDNLPDDDQDDEDETTSAAAKKAPAKKAPAKQGAPKGD